MLYGQGQFRAGMKSQGEQISGGHRFVLARQAAHADFCMEETLRLGSGAEGGKQGAGLAPAELLGRPEQAEAAGTGLPGQETVTPSLGAVPHMQMGRGLSF